MGLQVTSVAGENAIRRCPSGPGGGQLYEKPVSRTLRRENIAAVKTKGGKAQKAWVAMLAAAVLTYFVLILTFAFLFVTHRMRVDHEWGVLLLLSYFAWVAYRALQKRRNVR